MENLNQHREEDQVLRPKEAARILRLCPKTIRRLLRSGQLDGAKIGGSWLIPRKVVDDLLRTSKGE